MHDLDARVALPEPPRNLKEAPGIPRRHDARAGRENRGDLALEELAGHRRLEKIVDAGAAAAEVALGELDQTQARDAPQELARLPADVLAMREVTGVVVRDGHVEAVERQIRGG